MLTFRQEEQEGGQDEQVRGGWGVWLFCPKCGAPVFWKSNKGDQIAIFAGTLDDLRMYKPKK
jgi:hypothetical protein